MSSLSGGRSIPLRDGGSSEVSHCASGDQVSLDIEGVVDCAVGGNETLRLALRLEPLHFSFSSSDKEMRVFSPIVISQSTRLVALQAAQISQRGLV